MDDVHTKRKPGEYLSIDAEFRHGIDDAQEGWNGLGLFSNLGLVDLQIQIVMLEVLLNLLSIDIEYIHVGNRQDTAPFLVAFCKLTVFDIENSVQESEVVRDLLIPVHMEAVLGLKD